MECTMHNPGFGTSLSCTRRCRKESETLEGGPRRRRSSQQQGCQSHQVSESLCRLKCNLPDRPQFRNSHMALSTSGRHQTRLAYAQTHFPLQASQLWEAPASHSCLAVAAHCLPPLWRSQMQKARVLLARSGSAARTAPMCSTGNRLQIARPTAGRARADPSSSRTGCR